MTENFGRSISREFYALSDDEYINLPSQAPSLYLFSAYPSLIAARAGTGAVQSKTYWDASSVGSYKRSYSWDPVNDPDPTGSTSCRGYWEAINFIIDNSTKLTQIREIVIERPEAQDSVIPITTDDIKRLWTPISTYYSSSQIQDFINLAIDHFKLDIQREGIDWGRLQDLAVLRIPIAYKALAIAMRGQVRRDPSLEDLVKEFEGEYNSQLAGITLRYNQDNDGNIVEKETLQNMVTIHR